MLYRFRLDVDGKDVLVKTVVHTLQHRVVLGVLVVNGEILLDTLNALDAHILGNLNGIGTPRSYHLTTWTNEETFYCLAVDE